MPSAPRALPKALLRALSVPLVGGLLLLGAAAREHRPTPFGDTVAASAAPGARAVAADALRIVPGGAVQAYERRSGRAAWSYRRAGDATPLRLVPLAGGTTVAVWDDGMLTGMAPEPAAVRWHRVVPGVSAADPVRLVPLGDGETFLVMTSQLVMTYTTEDGTIRTSTLPPPGCSYLAGGAAGPVHVGEWVLALRACQDRSVLEGFSPDGRRWQRRLAVLGLSAAPDGVGVAVNAVPWRQPLLLDPVTGRAECGQQARECVCAAR